MILLDAIEMRLSSLHTYKSSWATPSTSERYGYSRASSSRHPSTQLIDESHPVLAEQMIAHEDIDIFFESVQSRVLEPGSPIPADAS